MFFFLILFQLLRDEVKTLTHNIEATSSPSAFDLARRGALHRKVTDHITTNGSL